MCEAKKLYENGITKRTIKKKCNYESYQDLYDDIFEINKELYKNIKFLSFNRGYSNKIKQSFVISTLDDLLKYKKYILLDNGNIDVNYANNILFSTKEIYDIFHGCTLCENCLSETKFNSYIKGYNSHCKKCRQQQGGKKALEKAKSTNMIKYGVNHPMQNDEIKTKKVLNTDYSNINDKIQSTCIEKYGDIFQRTKMFHEKREATCLERYSVNNVFQTSEVKTKIIITKLEKYGVEHHMKSIEFIDSIYAPSMMKKYGVAYTFQVLDIIEKCKQTNISKYGVDCIFKSSIFQNQIRLSKEASNIWLPLSAKNDYELYKFLVCRESEKEYLKMNVNFELRKSRTYLDAYELDHKFSIFNGFKQNIPFQIIASKHNLELIPWEENAKKGRNNSMEIEDLYSLYFNY